MPRPKAVVSRARRDEWELHRRELSRLFIVDGIPVAQIAEYMRNEHGFEKKPKDYEYRLKKWNLRRNLHELELRFIQNELSKRKEDGRPSEIVVSGVRWSESMVRGRLDRRMPSCLSNEQCAVTIPPEFLARVQTPSPLMLGLPEWPKELPWLQFNRSIHRALATLTTSTKANRMCHADGEKPLLIHMMRPYSDKRNSKTTDPLEDGSIHPPRRMRAILEMIAPQTHGCDHETTADILHTGSYESLAIELVRLIIYFESNNMIDQFEKLLGYRVRLQCSANMMDFLKNIGFLTKANINWLAGCTDSTGQTFLNRLLAHSIVDRNSVDVLGWLVPHHFDVSHAIPISVQQWAEMENAGSRLYSGVYWDDNWDDIPNATMLQASCWTGNVNAVRVFLDHGADPYGTNDPSGCTPLECASNISCHESALAIADLLLSKQTASSSEVQKVAIESALNLAIAGAHTQLIGRLVSEREHLGDWAICAQHFTIAARDADCATIRLLVEKTPRHVDGSISLPEGILFSVVPRRYGELMNIDQMCDKFDYLMELGADPDVPRCKYACMGSLLDFMMEFEAYRDHIQSKSGLGEDCLLRLIEAMRKYSHPQERAEPASSGNCRPSALQIALKLGYTRLVEYLLDCGADIDFLRDELGSETSTCQDCLSHLRERSWYPRRTEGCSPLLTALIYEKPEMAKMLLRRKPTLKLRGGEQKLAMKSGDDPELVDMLLVAGSAASDAWRVLFEQAVSNRNLKSIQFLLSKDTDCRAAVDPATLLRSALITGEYKKAYQQAIENDYDSRTLFEAVLQSRNFKGYHTIVECLLRRRTKRTNDGFEIRAVACAAENRDMHLLSCLMKHFRQGPWIAAFPPWHGVSEWVADGDEPHFWAHILSHAATLGRVDRNETVLKALLEVKVPAKGWRVAEWTNFSAETLTELIAAGLQPNQAILLFSAVQNNLLEHVRILCKANAHVNAVHCIEDENFDSSRTAAQLAVESGSPEMVQMLVLEYGADVDHPAGYYRGATCLQLAAGAGNIGQVRFLLHNGAKVNGKRSMFHGRTAVEIAAENGRLDVLQLLLRQDEHLFRTAAERYQFIRAAKMAEQNGHGSVVKMLREHITWEIDDERLFNEIPVCSYLILHFDDMTQKASESERLDRNFWANVYMTCDDAEVDFHDIDGIEQWIGDEEQDCKSEVDSSSEGEAGVHSSNSSATARPRAAEYDGLASDWDRHPELLPPHDHTDDGIVPSEVLNVEHMREDPGNQSQVLSINSGCRQVEIALAPQAIQHQNKVPPWLNMDDKMDESADDVAFCAAAEHGPAISTLHREFGMVFGELLEPHNDGLGGQGFGPFATEDGDGDSSFYNWGGWKEGVFREADSLNFDLDNMELD